MGNHPQFNCTECSYDLLKDFFIPMITGNLKISLKPEWTEIKSIHWLESFKLFFRYPDRALEFSPLEPYPKSFNIFLEINLRKFTTFLKFWARSYANTIGIFRYFYAFLAVFVHTNSILAVVSLLEIFWTRFSGRAVETGSQARKIWNWNISRLEYILKWPTLSCYFNWNFRCFTFYS